MVHYPGTVRTYVTAIYFDIYQTSVTFGITATRSTDALHHASFSCGLFCDALDHGASNHRMIDE